MRALNDEASTVGFDDDWPAQCDFAGHGMRGDGMRRLKRSKVREERADGCGSAASTKCVQRVDAISEHLVGWCVVVDE